MLYKPKHFSIDELTCEHIYDAFGDTAFSFFDPRLLITMDILREAIKKPIYVNSWQVHGEFSQRGFRCIQCDLVKKAIAENKIYVSAHMEGQACDFDIPGMTAEQVRQWIIFSENILPYNIRLESAVGWVHLDVRDGGKKVTLFNS
jgi:hypothetical protein